MQLRSNATAYDELSWLFTAAEDADVPLDVLEAIIDVVEEGTDAFVTKDEEELVDEVEAFVLVEVFVLVEL